VKGFVKPEIDKRNAEMLARSWNTLYPVGTLVRYWRMAKEGEPTGEGKTRSIAWECCGTPIVLIEGNSGGIALTHVEIVQEVPHA
jgi:hypothetical protein